MDIKPDWSQRFAAIGGVVTAMGSIAAVVVTIAALLSTNTANRAQQRLTEQGQITDRFSNAVEQLGSDKLDIRLGGIYALQRIMRDSPTDEPPIIDVLCAFIRTHAPREPDLTTTPAFPPLLNIKPTPPPDIQATLSVLANRPRADEPANRAINLRGANLRGANLRGANLRGANLRGANLGVAVVHEADLSGANLRGADLRAATLGEARLSGADLRGADLRFADLQGADLRFADLRNANLPFADLRGANLDRADLSGANLKGVERDDRTQFPSGAVVSSPTPSPAPQPT